MPELYSEDAFNAALDLDTPPPASTPPEPPPEPAKAAEPEAVALLEFVDGFAREIAEPEPVAETPGEQLEAEMERDPSTGRFVAKKKAAAKHEASPDDVPRIKELTAKHREAERERDALKTERDALRAERDALKLASTPQTPQKPREDAPEPTKSDFADPEPTLNDFAAEADPYAAYVRALARYDRKKEAFESGQQETASKALRDAELHVTKLRTAYELREVAFVKDHPDFGEVLTAGPQEPMTELMQAAILESDNGPALVYHLASHPELFYEMHLLTEGKPFSTSAVSTVQRLLTTRLAGADTGSPAALSGTPSVPRPPNPVRTGPLKTSDEVDVERESVEDYIRRENKQDPRINLKLRR